MSLCVLAEPCDGTIFADVGEYSGPCDPEAMIRDKRFVDWDGKVARHFVPVGYYEQFMDGGDDLFRETFKDFTHFAWFEYQDCDDWADFWIDHNNKLVGKWLLLMYTLPDGQDTGAYHWFNSEEDAQMFFVWLSTSNIQGLINDSNKSEGTEYPRSHASQII